MNMHRYLSILFFLFSLSSSNFSRLLPMEPPLKKQKTNSGKALDPALRNAFCPMIQQLKAFGVRPEKIKDLLFLLHTSMVTVEQVEEMVTVIPELGIEKVCNFMQDVSVAMKNFMSGSQSLSNASQEISAKNPAASSSSWLEKPTEKSQKTAEKTSQSSSKPQTVQSPQLKKALESSGFLKEKINNIPADDLAYPTKALACLLINGSKIKHLDIDKKKQNQGLNNANGNDCFLSSSFQVLSQLNPFMNALEEIYNTGKTNDLQNEFLEFVSSLRTNTSLVYKPAENAIAVMREFLTQGETKGLFIDKRMQRGQHDAQEFFYELLDSLTKDYPLLSSIFSIKFISTLKLTDEAYNNLKDFDSSLDAKKESYSSEQALELEANGDSLELCLQNFFKEETVPGIQWSIQDESTSEGVEATKQFRLATPLPLILNIRLKRSSIVSNKPTKLTTSISFPLKLSLENTNYRLVGVIVHSGSANGGHYWAYTKDRFKVSNPSDTWYLFNDEKKLEISDQVMQKFATDGKEKTGEGTPYMFFYERV